MLRRFAEWLLSEHVPIEVHNEMKYRCSELENKLQQAYAEGDYIFQQIENQRIKFLPALAERGRRVLGNLKQSKPRQVKTPLHMTAPHNVLAYPVAGSRALTQAYVVPTQLDKQCLACAMMGGKDWHKNPMPIYKGISVITEEELEVWNG